MPTGTAVASGATSNGTKRANASRADVLVRGAHSGHSSISQRRAQTCTGTSSGLGCHDSGSPTSSSKGSPTVLAWVSNDLNRSPSALVRNERLCCLPATDHRTIQGRLVRSETLRFWML